MNRVRVFAWVWTGMVMLSGAVPVTGAESAVQNPKLILVLGAAGEERYGTNFSHQAGLWRGHVEADGSATCDQVGGNAGSADEETASDRERVQALLAAEPKDGTRALWLVLIGHGTFDGKEARFNLHGPDFTANELAEWLQPFRRPLVIINTASASGPFLKVLSGTNRVVVTATRSGQEKNYARLGEYLAEAINDLAADLDKDGQVSVLEAFLTASRRVSTFYQNESRLATEHALLDDNGDGSGTPADWYRGLWAVRKPEAGASVDGTLARQMQLVTRGADLALTVEQRAERDALERAVLLYREKKGRLPESEYYRGLEELLLPLARFNQGTK